MTEDFDPGSVFTLLSPERMAPYLRVAGGHQGLTLELYEWNCRMSSTAFETVAHLEVLLRNAIDGALARHTREEERSIPWFLCSPPMREGTSETITLVRQRLQKEGRDSRHQIVAGLSFGFWTGMLGARYEDLWRSALRHAFPNSSGARKDVARDVEAIRKFRNRLAHHDSMLNIDIPFEMRRVHRVAAYIDTTASRWLKGIDRSLAVYGERPTFGFDTVVVPAKRAWPLYQDTQAYVCQPGRWFQPVERIAFYADQCIQAPVPKILYRRDNVTWTPREAERLADSDDRNDRKIASVITASREQGWAEGMYQVFLLSGSGDSQHRQLHSALPHETSGRGSAFVQRQRYVSLHQLETAHTTADLST